MTELKPCPFCGGEAEITHIEDGENAGGSCVSCAQCFASSNVEFEFKENFVSNWNRRITEEKEILSELLEFLKDHKAQFYQPGWTNRDRDELMAIMHKGNVAALSLLSARGDEITEDEIKEAAKQEASRWPERHALSSAHDVAYNLKDAIRILNAGGYTIVRALKGSSHAKS
jgi:Lar family restriction alleviation protein